MDAGTLGEDPGGEMNRLDGWNYRESIEGPDVNAGLASHTVQSGVKVLG